MKNVLTIIILPFILSQNIAHAQYLGYSKLLFFTNDTVKFFASAIYGKDFSCCPPLDTFQIQTIGDTMHVKLFYHVQGCVLGMCTSENFLYLSIIPPNTLKAVKLHPYDVGEVAPNVWDTVSWVKYDTIMLFPWTVINDIDNQYCSLSPNPAQEEITIKYTLPGEAILTDITGRRLSNYTLQAGKNKETIDIRHLAKGVYLMEYKRLDGITTTNKFLKE